MAWPSCTLHLYFIPSHFFFGFNSIHLYFIWVHEVIHAKTYLPYWDQKQPFQRQVLELNLSSKITWWLLRASPAIGLGSDHEMVCRGQYHGQDTKTWSRKEKIPCRTSWHWRVRSMAPSGGLLMPFLCPERGTQAENLRVAFGF
jgi:hypothetical protein